MARIVPYSNFYLGLDFFVQVSILILSGVLLFECFLFMHFYTAHKEFIRCSKILNDIIFIQLFKLFHKIQFTNKQ